jgi:hypothetical protein
MLASNKEEVRRLTAARIDDMSQLMADFVRLHVQMHEDMATAWLAVADQLMT